MKIEDFDIENKKDLDNKNYKEFGQKILDILSEYKVPENVIKRIIENRDCWYAFESKTLKSAENLIESCVKSENWTRLVAELDMMTD